jgi:sulfofructose kinase
MARVLCVGHAVQDFVFSVPRLPDRGAKFQSTAFVSVGGGPAATAAVTIARLGGEVALAARVGDDPVAGLIVAELESYGVDCRWGRRFPGCASSLSAVMLDPQGERMIVNHLDRRLPGVADWLPSPEAAGVRAVLADSRWPEGAAHALRQARAAGLPAVLDADQPVPRDSGALEAATHVAFSAEGLAELTGDDDPRRGLEAIAGSIPGWCCVTAGAAGVYAMTGGRLAHHEAFKVHAVDTLGAGDVWHGAFALALAEGRSEAEAIRLASAAAAIKVQRPGGRAGAPTRAEVDALLGRS